MSAEPLDVRLGDNETLAAMRAEAFAVADGGSPRVALIDVPAFRNHGDAAIVVGQLAALQGRSGVVMVAADTTFRPAKLRSVLEPGSTVYLQGGGSFGDLYPAHHAFRLSVIAELHDYRIVMFPQTCYFGGETTASADVVQAHPDLTLYFRDEHSRRTAEEGLGVPCSLAPDMAFALDVRRSQNPERRILWLARRDTEATRDERPMGPVTVADWPGWSWPARLLSRGIVEGLGQTRRLPWGADAVAPLASRTLVPLARRRLAAAVRLLSTASVVITDRLHGHILATLLGIPNVVVDTGYGKLDWFVATWTGRLSYVYQASDAAGALSLASALAAGGG